jgi:DNA-binding transcriptional ArsR family regulator
MATELALDAIGNPTRRAVLALLRNGEQTVRELTDGLPVTQSAVSQHLRVLHDAGLVTARAEGTRRLYSVDLGGLADVRAWVDSFWDEVLSAFVDFAESDAIATADPIATSEAAGDPAGGSGSHQTSRVDNGPGQASDDQRENQR